MNAADGDGLRAQLRAASLKERELWAKVSGKHPGQPGHDAALWAEWLKAADLVRELADRIRHSQPGDLA